MATAIPHNAVRECLANEEHNSATLQSKFLWTDISEGVAKDSTVTADPMNAVMSYYWMKSIKLQWDK